MATPGMGWQQPQHSYGGGGSAPGAGKLGSGSAQAGLGAEHSPDLHFKMSKKIAQLTKVRERPPGRAAGGAQGPLPPSVSSSVFCPAIASAEVRLKRGWLSGSLLNPAGRRPGLYPEGRARSGRLAPGAASVPGSPERAVPGSCGESSGVRRV